MKVTPANETDGSEESWHHDPGFHQRSYDQEELDDVADLSNLSNQPAEPERESCPFILSQAEAPDHVEETSIQQVEPHLNESEDIENVPPPPRKRKRRAYIIDDSDSE